MAATPVFDIAVPSADAALFTNGERALSVAADPMAVPNGTYYLSKRIELPPGVYFIKVKLSPGGTLKIGSTELSVNGLLRTQIDITAGEQRIDISLTKGGVGNCYAAFLIFLASDVIYASNADGWVFDTALLPNVDVPAPTDARLCMPVFTVRPNWANGVSEWVDYLTDVMTSEVAVEQRRAVREWPRRRLEASFLRKEVTRARLDTFMTGIGRKEFLVPLWHEQFPSPTGVTANEAYHQFPTDEDNGLGVREFMNGDAVLIDLGNPAEYEVAIVSTVEPLTGRLNWAVAPAKTWVAGVRLTPLRKAILSDKTSLANVTDRVATTRIRFDLTEPLTTFAADWGSCSPMWQFRVNRATDIPTDFDRLSYDIDNSSGPLLYTDPGKRALVSTHVSVTLRGRRDVREFRGFMAAARGRAVRFYAPSFTQAMVPIGDLGGITFDAEPMGFAAMFPTPQEARQRITVRLKDDSPLIHRTITSVSEMVISGKHVERYILNVALPPIKARDIERIEFLVPSRFDQDSFEFSHPVDNSNAVLVAATMRSVDSAGMETTSCDVTSPIYPVELVDAMNMGLEFTGGSMRGSPTPLDAMDVGFAINSGELRLPLITYNESPEALDTSFALTAGFIGQPLVSKSITPEGMDMGLVLTNGTLLVKLVSTTITPEGMDTAFAFTSGVFSTDPGTQTWDLLDVAWDGTEETWGNTDSGTYVDI